MIFRLTNYRTSVRILQQSNCLYSNAAYYQESSLVCGLSIIQLQLLDNVCSEILNLDKAIRFVGMASADGKNVYHRYRLGLEPLLSPDENSKSILQAVIKEGMRSTLEDKMGGCLYVLEVYRKVKRVTIPLRPPTVREGSHAILMMSLEFDSSHDDIINNKVFPFLQKKTIDL
jgi:hypothetical protein